MAEKSHTILIPVFNGGQHLQETIENMLDQKDVDPLIVISDNNSTDGTTTILSRYADNSRVRIFRQQKNIGMFGNFNFLLNQVKSDTFTMISHDDMFSTDTTLCEALEQLEADRTLSSVFSDMWYIDAQGQTIGYRRRDRSGRFDAKRVARDSIIYGSNLFGIPLAIRSDVLKLVPTFDESIQYAADLDFAIAVSRLFGGPFHIPKTLVKYRVHGSNNTLKVQNSVFADLELIAEKNGIRLTVSEKILQSILTRLLIICRNFALNASSFVRPLWKIL